ncbi:Clavaminate synthase-like protein [Flagelloscypha sp. PMI_526]|nr:Clavaminate synthase-like protein [Flagelloscypha sp. PMI_526]
MDGDDQHEHTKHALESIRHAAHQKMPGSEPSELRRLRLLYADTSILLAFQSLFLCLNAQHESTRQEKRLFAVSLLDHAIIITGPPQERYDLIQALILRIQVSMSPSSLSIEAVEPDKASPNLAKHLPTAINEVAIYTSLPSLSSFAREAALRPFVLKGLASEWPAVTSWLSPEYLLRVTGLGRIVPVEVGSDYRSDEWAQRLMPWEDFLRHLFSRSPYSNDSEVLYLAQHNIFSQFPDLRNDFHIPDYVYAGLNAPASFPSYEPPTNDEQLVINAWIGDHSARSPAHIDPFFNLYAQVVGRKQVWLAPPSMSSRMYPLERARNHPAENKLAKSEMSNTSRIDVFSDDPLDVEFPDFASTVPQAALSVVLEPGDVLCFPPGWWHAMRVYGAGPSMSLSFWF